MRVYQLVNAKYQLCFFLNHLNEFERRNNVSLTLACSLHNWRVNIFIINYLLCLSLFFEKKAWVQSYKTGFFIDLTEGKFLTQSSEEEKKCSMPDVHRIISSVDALPRMIIICHSYDFYCIMIDDKNRNFVDVFRKVDCWKTREQVKRFFIRSGEKQF